MPDGLLPGYISLLENVISHQLGATDVSASFKSQASIRLALQKVEDIWDLRSGKLDEMTRAVSDADILGYQAKTLQVFREVQVENARDSGSGIPQSRLAKIELNSQRHSDTHRQMACGQEDARPLRSHLIDFG